MNLPLTSISVGRWNSKTNPTTPTSSSCSGTCFIDWAIRMITCLTGTQPELWVLHTGVLVHNYVCGYIHVNRPFCLWSRIVSQLCKLCMDNSLYVSRPFCFQGINIQCTCIYSRYTCTCYKCSNWTWSNGGHFSMRHYLRSLRYMRPFYLTGVNKNCSFTAHRWVPQPRNGLGDPRRIQGRVTPPV